MQNGKFVSRSATPVVDAGLVGGLSATGDTMVVDVEDLDQVTAIINNTTFGGTATIKVDGSADGVNWIEALGSKANSDFAASGDAVIGYTLSDAHGLPLVLKQIRFRCSVATAGGVYTGTVTGRQTENFR